MVRACVSKSILALSNVCLSHLRVDAAVVYGRQGGGLQKKKFRLIDLWECKVSDETESIPAVVNTAAGITNPQEYVHVCARCSFAATH